MTFENKYINTKKLLSSFYKVCVCRTYRAVGALLIFLGLVQLLVILLGATGILESTLSSKMKIVFFDLGLITVALGILLRMYHKIMGRIAYKQGLKTHKGEMKETTVTLADKINVVEGKSSLTYDYLYIKSIYDAEGFYGLMLGKYSGILVDKKSFTKGTLEEFDNFIRGKCTNAKIRCYTKRK